MSELTLFLADEQAMVEFGARIAQVTQGVGVIFLEGDLGAGKTTSVSYTHLTLPTNREV